ncbi:MAG: DNA (cytosine-5-)-methyltransferase [Candidatus Nealsonbacteria bacterium CG08_land_8_20_14_0_20_36_22]|uniref:Cytosine-specific methyltransferase n=1 Tax=Candidatus Nealsonbacteria bacterium CG08_land_8_20_14_0_20_36_22 TaxID=1974704 RepID=A0A2H0YQK8_9BACT|nr:MAG: DNA (cytosine-5-)-methyltransferase [Candidatus Nealsonbacteria bacterium CG08_land_8_20_14_0_20_36_22]
MNKQKQTIKVVSLFCGCGGGDLGLRGGFKFLNQNYSNLGFEIIWANDIDKYAVETYRTNFGNHIVEKDVKKIKSGAIPNHDLLVGGFPCQSFSIVGRRKGLNDPRGRLYSQMIRILKSKNPTAFIAENVKGLASIEKGKILEKILKDFRSAGYNVYYKILNSAFYGVPQKRERLFIVGVRSDRNINFKFPHATEKIIPLARVIEGHKKIAPKYYFSKRALEGLKMANKAFNKGRAQDLSGPCNTISTHLAKVSLNGTDPVLLVENNCYRRLTPREAARIQSFPENFIFNGSESKQYIQIGNAIPPVLMWHIGEAMKEQVFYDRCFYQKEAKRDNVSYPFKKYEPRKERVCVFEKK